MTELNETDPHNPAPQHNEEQPIVDRLIIELLTRKGVGIQRYGTALRPFNGRNPHRDAFEESLDMTLYQMQAWIESESKDQRVQELEQRLDAWEAYDRMLIVGLRAISMGPDFMWSYARTHRITENPHTPDNTLAKLIVEALLNLRASLVKLPAPDLDPPHATEFVHVPE